MDCGADGTCLRFFWDPGEETADELDVSLFGVRELRGFTSEADACLCFFFFSDIGTPEGAEVCLFGAGELSAGDLVLGFFFFEDFGAGFASSSVTLEMEFVSPLGGGTAFKGTDATGFMVADFDFGLVTFRASFNSLCFRFHARAFAAFFAEIACLASSEDFEEAEPGTEAAKPGTEEDPGYDPKATAPAALDARRASFFSFFFSFLAAFLACFSASVKGALAASLALS